MYENIYKNFIAYGFLRVFHIKNLLFSFSFVNLFMEREKLIANYLQIYCEQY